MTSIALSAALLFISLVLLLRARRWRGRLRVILQMTLSYAVGTAAVLLLIAIARFYRLDRSDLLGLIGIAATVGVTLAASQLIRGMRTLSIGVVISSMRPFHREVRRGIADAIQGREYSVLDPYNEGDYPEEDLTSFARCLSTAIRARADYLIVCAPAVALAESPGLQHECLQFTSRGGHLVFIESVPNRDLLECLKFATTLTSDSEAGAQLIARFFAEAISDGAVHHILVVPGPAHSRPAAQRLQALKAALPDTYRMAIRNTLTWTGTEARDVVEEYLKHDPSVDAICCGNDDMAIGAAEAVAASGARVQCITGHDGLLRAVAAVADPFSPVSATVRIPPSAFGTQAVTAIDALPVHWKLLLPGGFRRCRWNQASSQVIPITGASLITKYNAELLLD